MLRFVEEIHFTRSFGNIPRIFRAICIAAQMLHLLIFPQVTVTLSEFGHLSELGAFTLWSENDTTRLHLLKKHDLPDILFQRSRHLQRGLIKSFVIRYDLCAASVFLLHRNRKTTFSHLLR